MTLSHRWLVAFAVLLASSCGPKGGTDVGNGATVTFDLSGYEEPTGSSAQALTLTSGTRVDEVWVAVERFQLEGGDCTGAETGDVDVEGPIVRNLIAPGAGIGQQGLAEVEPGPYCRLRLELHEVALEELPMGAPTELSGASILIRGVRADGVSFTVRSRQGVEFRLDAKNGSFEISGDEDFFVGFELGALLASLDLGSLGPGAIVIDEDTNTERLEPFNDTLKTAARLFRDENEDGALDESESSDEKELAEGKD